MNEINWKHLDKFGSFDEGLWFADKFHTIPYKTSINCRIEGQVLDVKELYQKLTKATPEFFYTYCEIDPLNQEADINEDDLFAWDSHTYSNDEFLFRGISEEIKAVISFNSNNLTLCYLDEEYCKEFMSKALPLVKECFHKSDTSTKVSLITYNGRDYDLSECKIMNTAVNIDENYNNDFKSVYNDIVQFLNNPKSGLIMLHGTPGTGKTYLIRHLINNFNKKFIIVTNAMMNSMCDPVFLNFILDHKNSVLILEDCEQLLTDRSKNTFTDGIANILNMTDGLYSDILNIKFICTFNSRETVIDPALMRKGRLVAKYHFEELCLEKTNALLSKLGYLPSKVPMLLTDIYNQNDTSYADKQKIRPLGFNKN